MTDGVNDARWPWAELATLFAEQVLLGGAFVAGAAVFPWLCRPDNRFGQGFHHYLGRMPRPERTWTGGPVVAPIGKELHCQYRSGNLWLHAVSLGEGLAASALIPALAATHPDLRVCVTTTHPDALAALRRRPGVTEAAYFPLDLLPAQQRALTRWKPAAILLTETDFWPGLCCLAQRRGVPLVLVNGRISTKIHGFYRRVPPLARLVFGAFRLFLVQTETDRERLLDLGVEPMRIVITGNLKADVTPTPAPAARAAINAWCGQNPLWLLGSLHPREFEMMLPHLSGLLERHPRLRVLIAPRAIANVEVWARKLAAAGIETVCRSVLPSVEFDNAGAVTSNGRPLSEQIQGGDPPCTGTPVVNSHPEAVAADTGTRPPASNRPTTRVCLLDTLGELADLYGLATLAFVGGSLDPHVGGHNPLEPLHHGTPLMMGPHCRNFAALVDELTAAGGIQRITDGPSLGAAVSNWLENPAAATAAAAAGTPVHARHRGAMARTIAALGEVLAGRH